MEHPHDPESPLEIPELHAACVQLCASMNVLLSHDGKAEWACVPPDIAAFSAWWETLNDEQQMEMRRALEVGLRGLGNRSVYLPIYIARKMPWFCIPAEADTYGQALQEWRAMIDTYLEEPTDAELQAQLESIKPTRALYDGFCAFYKEFHRISQIDDPSPDEYHQLSYEEFVERFEEIRAHEPFDLIDEVEMWRLGAEGARQFDAVNKEMMGTFSRLQDVLNFFPEGDDEE